jgi:hypothetical protein
MNTLLLDTVTWDLVEDASGNIAVASDPYSIEQDVASACRVFKGEVWYNTAIGIAYLLLVLGKRPSAALLKTLLIGQAVTVSGVASAKVFLFGTKNRGVGGQIQSTLTNGTTVVSTVPLG